jgi:hypothetical protein
MPFPFVLPTTSAFSFSSSVTCQSHPSLPLSASTHRGVVRDTLKKHKRLPPPSQAANLSLVISAVSNYAPYVLTLDAGLGNKSINGEALAATITTPPKIEWRPTLSDALVPGREAPRVKVTHLEHEILFALSTLATAHALVARSTLQPLHVTSVAPLGPEGRAAAITSATRSLLTACSIFAYLAARPPPTTAPPPCADVAPPVLLAQKALALAEATLLAVLKDDPYPTAAAQARNVHDTEWMFKAPDIPKVRAHLFARLCLAASEHAAEAAGLCSGQKLADSFAKYVSDLRGCARAKACRFFAIDAELGGKTGEAIGWVRAGLAELGVEASEGGKRGFGLGRLKKEFKEKREDKKVEKGAAWGIDAGRSEEVRVLEMLETKWVKQNDTVSMQISCTAFLGLMIVLLILADEHTTHPSAGVPISADAIRKGHPLGKAF